MVFLKPSYCVNILWRHLIALSRCNKQLLLRTENQLNCNITLSSEAIWHYPKKLTKCSLLWMTHSVRLPPFLFPALPPLFTFFLSLSFLPSFLHPFFSFVFQEVHLKKSAVSLDDSDIEARLNSWNLGVKQVFVFCMYIHVEVS